MTRLVSKAEGFEKAFQAFEQIQFTSFDFDTIRQSMFDYIKLYFPESFNILSESPRFNAVIELFAYLAELVSYRTELNSHENFITVAQRKDSILRLAKLISYTTSRNIPARGLVKINSVNTSETIIDSNGNDLTNVTINWNDSTNNNWKEQFFLVMNKILEQKFGTVKPSDRIKVDNIVFELYNLNNNRFNNGVLPYTISLNNETFTLELVPGALDSFGPYEKRPDNLSNFSLFYADDDMGDGSDHTGFLIYTKQGTLQKITTEFEGVTPNQTLDITVNNINELDVWLNNINPETLDIIDDSKVGTDIGVDVTGKWDAVNTLVSNSRNTSKQNVYKIETLENDTIQLVFGDGVISTIPKGTFDVWFRVSQNTDLAVPRASVSTLSEMTYQDMDDNTQTISFGFNLVSALQNSSTSETIEHVRQYAPDIYYTQDRMTNARDYNTYLLQDPSIAKLKVINRTFSGDSKYASWFEEKTHVYQNVKIHGDDALIYFTDSTETIIVNDAVSGTELLVNHIQPILTKSELFLLLHEQAKLANGVYPARKVFTDGSAVQPLELELISEVFGEPTEYNLTPPTPTFPIGLYFNFVTGMWTADNTVPSNTVITVDQILVNSVLTGWTITFKGLRLLVHSESTRFWYNKGVGNFVEFDTTVLNPDIMQLVEGNLDPIDRTCSLQRTGDINFTIIDTKFHDLGLPNAGEINYNELNLLPADSNNDNIPDSPTLDNFLDPLWVLPVEELFFLTGLINGVSTTTGSLALIVVAATDPIITTSMVNNTLFTQDPIFIGEVNSISDVIAAGLNNDIILSGGVISVSISEQNETPFFGAVTGISDAILNNVNYVTFTGAVDNGFSFVFNASLDNTLSLIPENIDVQSTASNFPFLVS